MKLKRYEHLLHRKINSAELCFFLFVRKSVKPNMEEKKLLDKIHLHFISKYFVI